jgi:hypothetical protein
LRDPMAVYTAASNLQSSLICDMLAANGVESSIVEDVSQAGHWMFGLLPGIHKPQIWVDRADAERARALIDEFERQAVARRAEGEGSGETVDVVCDECNTICTYPAARWGYVEVCAHCGAFVDVGEPEDWGEGDSEEV